MKRTPVCELCKKNEATWIMQFIKSYYPTFTSLNFHKKGFKQTKVCRECKETIKDYSDYERMSNYSDHDVESI